VKLNELIGVKKHHDKNRYELIDFLDAFTPFKQHGKGKFSAVFERGGKIYKFWMGDSAYEKFAKFAMERQGNEHLPKFLSKIKKLKAFHKRSTSSPEEISYVQIEKLESFNSLKLKNYRGGIVALTADLTDAINMKKTHLWKDAPIEKASDYISALENWIVDSQLEEPGYELPDEIQSYIQTMFLIHKTINSPLDRMDVHTQNIMMRDNVIVITDPVVHGIDVVMADKMNIDDFKIAHQIDDENMDVIKGPVKHKISDTSKVEID